MASEDVPGTRQVDWKALVAEVEDLEAPVPAYEFSRRTFDEYTDRSGVYNTDE